MFDKGYLSLGIRTYLSYPFAFIMGGVLLALISLASLGVLLGPCLYGVAYMTRKALRGEPVSFIDAFQGFVLDGRLGPSLVCGLVTLALVGAAAAFGVFLAFIPGFVVAAVLCWMFPILADDPDARFRSAFFGSIEFVEARPVDRGLFALLLVFLGFLAFIIPIFCVFGLVTAPWAFVTLCAAWYREVHPGEAVRLPEPPPQPEPPAPPSRVPGPGEEKGASADEPKPTTSKAAAKKSTSRKSAPRRDAKRKTTKKKPAAGGPKEK